MGFRVYWGSASWAFFFLGGGGVGLVTALCTAASQETTPWTQKPEARISRMLYWALLGCIALLITSRPHVGFL